MSRPVLFLIAFLLALGVGVMVAQCNQPPTPLPLRLVQAQAITPTLTLTVTLTVTPTVTTTFTPTPEPTQPVACAVMSYWSVPEGGLAYIEARPLGGQGRWMPYATVDTPWPLPSVVLYGEFEYLVGIPGPTTPLPATAGPTPLPAPTQTPWIVTATPEPTVAPTATPTPRAGRIYVVPMLRKWGRWQWDPPIPRRP